MLELNEATLRLRMTEALTSGNRSSTFQVASLTSPTSIDDKQRSTLPPTSESRRRQSIELQQLWLRSIDRQKEKDATAVEMKRILLLSVDRA
eukprot:3032198-Pyramimonas_sp.AAC.1